MNIFTLSNHAYDDAYRVKVNKFVLNRIKEEKHISYVEQEKKKR